MQGSRFKSLRRSTRSRFHLFWYARCFSGSLYGITTFQNCVAGERIELSSQAYETWWDTNPTRNGGAGGESNSPFAYLLLLSARSAVPCSPVVGTEGVEPSCPKELIYSQPRYRNAHRPQRLLLVTSIQFAWYWRWLCNIVTSS